MKPAVSPSCTRQGVGKARPLTCRSVCGSQIRDTAQLCATADAAGHTLESSAVIGSPTWVAVPGVTGNSATLTAGAGTGFYRLRK